MSWWKQVVAVARSEAQVEHRAGDVLWVAVPFGLAALLLLAIASGADVPALRRLGPGLYWALVLLFGTLVALRQASAEPDERRDALLLAGLDPGARHLGRTTVAAGALIAFGGVLVPALVVLYDPPAEAALRVIAFLPVVAAGLAALGTLAADLTATLRQRNLLAPLLVVPLAVPLAVAATQAAEGATYGQSPLPWLVLAVTVDVVVLTAGLAAAPALQPAPSTTRDPDAHGHADRSRP